MTCHCPQWVAGQTGGLRWEGLTSRIGEAKTCRCFAWFKCGSCGRKTLIFLKGEGGRLTPPEAGWGQVLGASISTSLRTSHLTQERPLWVGGPPQEQGEEELSSDQSGVRCCHQPGLTVRTAGRAVELAYSFIQRQRNEQSREGESKGKYRRPSVSKGDWFQDAPRIPNSEDAQIP